MPCFVAVLLQCFRHPRRTSIQPFRFRALTQEVSRRPMTRVLLHTHCIGHHVAFLQLVCVMWNMSRMVFASSGCGVAFGCQIDTLTTHCVHAAFINCRPGSNTSGFLTGDTAYCVATYVVDGVNPPNTSCCLVSVFPPCQQLQACIPDIYSGAQVCSSCKGVDILFMCKHEFPPANVVASSKSCFMVTLCPSFCARMSSRNCFACKRSSCTAITNTVVIT
jgi:hypothetical protein